MYSTRAGLILAFHGCDESTVDDIISGKSSLNQSINKYDWLGHGIYFWDNSPVRALEYATFLKKNPGRARKPIKNPAVIGAVINLGRCLDLLDFENLELVKLGYKLLEISHKASGFKMPANKSTGAGNELLLRELDCAVIEMLHQVRKNEGLPMFDSVRGVFWEGEPLYPNAGFREKDHIQICIRNPNCIKGYFLPRTVDSKFNTV